MTSFKQDSFNRYSASSHPIEHQRLPLDRKGQQACPVVLTKHLDPDRVARSLQIVGKASDFA
jgi:hypothetical protein